MRNFCREKNMFYAQYIMTRRLRYLYSIPTSDVIHEGFLKQNTFRDDTFYWMALGKFIKTYVGH